MKKYIALLLSLTFALTIAGCGKISDSVDLPQGGADMPNVENNGVIQTEQTPQAGAKERLAMIPMVMVDDVLYLDTGYTSTEARKCGTPDGEITSAVHGSEKPAVNNQSNFGTGYGYQYGATEGTVEIYMNDKWRIFATEEVRQQIQFPENTDSGEAEADRDDTLITASPALTVVCGDSTFEAWRGESSWIYRNDDGTEMGIISDSAHPLQAQRVMPSLFISSASPVKVHLQWDVTPDSVSARCWSEEHWGQPDAESVSIPVEALETETADGRYSINHFVELKDGNCIYEVIAEWNSAEKYSGTACYAFYTIH